MLTDAHGLQLTTTHAEAVTQYDTTIQHFLEYRLDATEHLQQTLAADPGFVMGHCLKGYLLLLACTATTRNDARQSLACVESRTTGLTRREQGHVEALRAWCAGDLARACAVWEEILTDYPTDIVALRLQHFAAFWMGRSFVLRDGIARVFPAWDAQMPGYSYVLGMYAFGLEEAGDYAAAEAHGKRAVERNPDDLWAIHAVAHVLEMQGRVHDGLRWLDYPPNAWEDRSAMQGHLWWHLALYPFELGDFDRVLALYDRSIWKGSGEFYIDIQNAASMLTRLEFQGVDVGTRWQELAAACEADLENHLLPFTNLHLMLAFTAAGRHEAVTRLLTVLQASANTPHDYAATTMQPVTIPLCESMQAYRNGDYGAAVDRMLPMRYDYACIGGSHAQRDVFAQFLIEAALKDERWSLARALLAERVALHPASRGSWLKYAEVLERLGATAQAEAARQHGIALSATTP